MRKLKFLLFTLAMIVGVSSAWAGTDVTASYIGDFDRCVGENGKPNGHTEADGIGWWNNQTFGDGWHAFVKNGDAIESWTSSFGNAGVMLGRTMVLPSGNYTLSFDAFACNATNSAEPTTLPSAGDAVAFLTGQNNVDITNIAAAGDGTFHTVSFTFDVTTDNTAYEFGIKKLTDGSKIDWCQIKNVSLVLNSTNIFPIDNNSTASFTYSGSQDWHTNTWSTEGQSDGSRFQVPFHELWVANGSQLADATIKASYTPTESGFYKVSAWVRTVNEAEANNVSGVNFFVGNSETDACTGNSVIDEKGRLNTHTALIYGVSETPFEYGLKVKNANINWLAFKNVTVTYLGAGSASSGIDITQLITNPSFSSAYTTGWTLDGTAPNAYNSTYGAYENYHRVGGLHQDLTDLPNGVYKVTMQAAVSDGKSPKSFYLYATTSNGTTKTHAIDAPQNNFENTAKKMSEEAEYGRIETYAIVTDGNLTIGHYENYNSTWPVFDNYTLTYYGEGSDAYALAMASEAAKANTSISAMEDGSMKTAMNAAYSTKSANPTLANIQWMTFIANSKSELVEASNLGIAADAVAAVDYIETISGSHSTYTDAISAFQSSVTSATTTDAITTAMTTLKSAIKTYIASAKPANEGEYFDITCLMENPSFDNNNASGWSGDTPGFQSYNNAEFFNKNFDFYQNIDGLPNGSYSLSVQAFCRPGDNGNETAGAYYDFTQGINNITAELYVNSDASTIGNIYSYKGNTTGAKVVGNDFHCNISPDDYWVPNNMQGAGLYFADNNVYKTTVAALVEDGNLKIGFREENKKTNQWVIFDNFHLYYYGTSKMIYYKQYLPQLEAEIAENYLNNGAYSILKTGQTERTALETANSADADELNTEEALQDAIDAITAARDNFVAAKTAYDNLLAATTAYTYNVGDGVFQMSSSQKTTFDGEVSTASTMYSTGTASKSTVEAQITAIANAYVLNAPDADKRYYIKVAKDDHVKNGNAVMLDYSEESKKNGDYDSNPNGFIFVANAEPAAYLSQAVRFTQVSGNTYNIIFEDATGSVYLTYGNKAGSRMNWKEQQIEGTRDEANKGTFRVYATATNNVINIYNTQEGYNNPITYSTTTPGGSGTHRYSDLYTNEDNASFDFTVVEASQASVGMNIAAEMKYGTRIFPFNPSLPEGVKAYSCEATEENKLTLVEVAEPVANTPYILEAVNGCTSTDLQGWGTASTTKYTAGWLTGVYTDTDAEDGTYVLQNNNNKFGFYLVNTEVATPTVGAYRCYLTVPAGGDVRAAFFFDDELSGIEAVNALTQGKSTIYDANGRQITTLQKGMNIVKSNGKTYKVIVK